MPATLDDVLAELNANARLLQLLIDLLTPKLRIEEFNKSISGGNNFDALSTSHPASAFRVVIAADAAGILSIVRSKLSQSATTATTNLNNGTLLTANAETTFDILATDDEQVTFQYSVNTKLLVFKVYEVPLMTE